MYATITWWCFCSFILFCCVWVCVCLCVGGCCCRHYTENVGRLRHLFSVISRRVTRSHVKYMYGIVSIYSYSLHSFVIYMKDSDRSRTRGRFHLFLFYLIYDDVFKMKRANYTADE